ncbi:MAG: hypothetical protein N2688_06355 [Burkholderiaceae bacterium]|nr:hypothetical protein [Burkholderiaceae bacterium]
MRIGRESAGKGRGQIEMVVDRVIRYTAVRGQQAPEFGQVAAQFRAEAPDRKRAAVMIDVARAVALDQCAQVIGAERLRVRRLHIVGNRRQPMPLSGERMDQHRVVGEDDLLPSGVTAIAPRFRKGGSVGRRGPVVGAPDSLLDRRQHALRKNLFKQRAHGARFVPLSRAQQDQRLLRRVMQARRQPGL